MQTVKAKAEANGQKAKLANSYQQLLDEFSSSDLRTVGNYNLGRLIGKGSFGKVYLATHKLTNGSKVVLKSANKTDSNLAREIHHHRQFIHPHIARLYEVIVTESLVWMVLEYCSGDELYNYLLDYGPLPVAKVQKIFAQLVGAVTYVHMQSCVHRDLKLENILFDKHENVKLVDFGFTREYEGRTNHLQTFCGTICYSAPEMLKGEKYAGEKVDVWSLGIILYALLCGELPFDDDDDNVTRSRILTEEPEFPPHMPGEAIPLIKMLLSKRPLLRPGLPEILDHPFLAEHAPAQHAILNTKANAPFTTATEKDCLSRMRSAGVDTDLVMESVTSQKCDALAGWWNLLVDKEERKINRRDRKKKEKEKDHEHRARRLSAASSRLERFPPALQDVDEDGGLTTQFIKLGEHPPTRSRGRTTESKRSQHFGDLGLTDFKHFPADGRRRSLQSLDEPPPPIDKDSSARCDSISANGSVNKAIGAGYYYGTSGARSQTAGGSVPPVPPITQNHQAQNQKPTRPRVSTSHSHKRQSLSPSPLTPRSTTVRRSSAGLRGRESTSSSVSSVRSMHHHHHTHSKASSISSAGSVSTSKTALARGQSPHHSVKVLPATPTFTQFPSNIRLVRAPVNMFNEGMPSNQAQPPGSPNPFAQGGVMFAKRKKNLFKGPTLNFGPALGGGRTASPASKTHSRNGSTSALGRRSGEITIQEEEEDDDEEDMMIPDEDEFEEEETFAHAAGGPGEAIDEQHHHQLQHQQNQQQQQEGALEDEGLTPTTPAPGAQGQEPRTPTQTKGHRLFGAAPAVQYA
ncbi:putative serine/threonine-protein kinase [Escovopsis weberi]|uniref:Putative serine/threonine-protein kinase n=1 Tax=Escovopsis weberi TaxID=150374 RepID=A0A0M8N6A3_ESCWE|nr:putative serine/threonine-protein kinase [Escovopsis weberi]